MSATAGTPKREQLLRIGEVVGLLRDEFPDISISKIRFLEDAGLISPQRTPSGYRLFTEHDLERLETILRLQRDEFLPLKVIRDELATPGATERKRRRPGGLGERIELIDLDELCRRAGVTREQAKDLEDFGLLAGIGTGAEKRYAETDADIAVVCAQLTRYGVDARHLRTFRTAADREAVAARPARGPGVARAERREARGRPARPSVVDRARSGARLAAPVAQREGGGEPVSRAERG